MVKKGPRRGLSFLITVWRSWALRVSTQFTEVSLSVAASR